MPTQPDLYQSILDDPLNDTPRLVYADWCEENGDADRAEFIRTQLDLDSVHPFDNRYHDLQDRADDLLASNRKSWLSAVD